MARHELADLVAERKPAHAQVVTLETLFFELHERFLRREIAAADGDDAEPRALPLLDDGLRDEFARVRVLPEEPLHHVLVLGRDLGVAAELVVPRSAREERALRVHAGERARRHARLVFGRVASELGQRLELLLRQHLPPVGLVGVVPLEARDDPVVHADVEIGQHEHGRLEPLREIERLGREVEALGGVRGEEEDVLRVAVRGVRAEEDVSLLGARRHARRGADALDVDDDGGDLGVVREPDELVHERDARPGRRRERARAVPPRADDHADRRQLVLGLEDAVALLARRLVGAKALALRLERVEDARGRRDRVPRGDRRARVQAPERGRRVAVDEDRVLRHVHAREADRQRALEVLDGVVVPELDGLLVRLHQRGLLRELLGEHPADDVHVDPEQRRERPGVGDVLHERPLARSREGVVAELRVRHPEERHVAAEERVGQGPRRVVEHVAARLHLLHVARVRLRVHRDHQIVLARPRGVAVLVDADLVPGRQPLDVRREQVLPRDGDPHAEDRLHEEAVGAGRARPVHVGELDGEIVRPRRQRRLHRFARSALQTGLPA